jgi:ATP-dependent RNA helicase RhlE
MYKSNSSGSDRINKFGGSRGSSGRSFSGRGFSRGGRSGGFNSRSRSGGGFRGGFRGGSERKLDYSMYINHNVVEVQEVAYVPEHKFEDFKFSQKLKTAIAAKGYVDPTPIQDKSIADILEGKDLIGIANTGTGKTAAFLLPLIQKVLEKPQSKILIVVPTRELAQQIEEEFKVAESGLMSPPTSSYLYRMRHRVKKPENQPNEQLD